MHARDRQCPSTLQSYNLRADRATFAGGNVFEQCLRNQ